MTQEEKQLLLVDLCGRLPYEVKITIEGDIPIILNQISYNDGYVGGNNECYSLEQFVIKPYLFPMSSMTEWQERELEILMKNSIESCGMLYPYDCLEMPEDMEHYVENTNEYSL